MNRQGNLFALATGYHLRVDFEQVDFEQEVAHGWGTQGPGRRGVRWAQR
jgi:hypothetical protein